MNTPATNCELLEKLPSELILAASRAIDISQMTCRNSYVYQNDKNEFVFGFGRYEPKKGVLIARYNSKGERM